MDDVDFSFFTDDEFVVIEPFSVSFLKRLLIGYDLGSPPVSFWDFVRFCILNVLNRSAAARTVSRRIRLREISRMRE